ncbi:MAG TPA: HD domain-containing protein [Ktedonobacteraceae bacterium]
MTVEALRKTHVLVEKLFGHLQGHFSQEDIDLVKKAWTFAEDHYANIGHPAGKPYLEYAAEIATRLVELRADPIALGAALIYPPSPTTIDALNEIKKHFKGKEELIMLVEEVLQLSHLERNLWSTSATENEYKQRQDTLQKMFLLAIDEAKDENQEQSSLMAAHFLKKEKQAENLITMFLAAITDTRALIIKLVDRLYFMKLLKDLKPTPAESINYTFLSKITLAIYAPIADRLGMWRLKSQLEDMSFRLLAPEKYTEIAGQLAIKKQEREDFINNKVIPDIAKELNEYGIEAKISGRAKHIYSIYQKMVAKQLDFEEINDLIGIRIVVDTINDCYTVQSILHAYWLPKTDFYNGKAGRDWIANPKENLYQSLHTTIYFDNNEDFDNEQQNDKGKNKVVEVQIRTHTMHEIAEYGVAVAEYAAHWRYKESKTYRKSKTPRGTRTEGRSKQLANLQDILESERVSTVEHHKDLIKDLIKSRIFVITPKGHVIDLPTGATPLDFAYRIHTDLGHRYTGAKVNGHIVRLQYKLKNGDIVELITSRARKGPNPEWLAKSKDDEGKSNYLFAQTPQARSKIVNWLNKYDEEYRARHVETQKPKHDDIHKPGTKK